MRIRSLETIERLLNEPPEWDTAFWTHSHHDMALWKAKRIEDGSWIAVSRYPMLNAIGGDLAECRRCADEAFELWMENDANL